MDKKLVLCFLLAVGLALGGCWDYREINDLAIVLAAGVDGSGDGGVRLLVEIARADQMARGEGGSQGGAATPVLVLETTGATVHDAHRNLHWRSPREINWSHTQAVIIGEDLARRGIAPVLDWFDRDEQARRTLLLLVTNGPARNIFQAQPEHEATLAEEINMLVKRTNEKSQGYVPLLNDFLYCLNSGSRHPVAGCLEVVEVEEPQEGRPAGSEKGGGQGDGAGRAPLPPRALRLAGLAVFKEDRLVGWLDERETRGFLWIIDAVRGTLVDITASGAPGSLITLEVRKADSQIMPLVKDGRVSFQVKVKILADIGQLQGEISLTPSLFPELEAACSAVVKREIEDTLARVQGEYRVDIFGFGEELHRRFPKVWKEREGRWGTEFSDVPIEIVVESRIERAGLVTGRVPVREK